jgi:hypothetical protein
MHFDPEKRIPEVLGMEPLPSIQAGNMDREMNEIHRGWDIFGFFQDPERGEGITARRSTSFSERTSITSVKSSIR